MPCSASWRSRSAWRRHGRRARSGAPGWIRSTLRRSARGGTGRHAVRSGTAMAWRAVQWIVGVVVIGLAIRSLVRNWSELRHQMIVLEFRPLHLVGSLVLVWVVYALLIAAWRQMLTGWGQRLDPWGAARI